MAKKALRFGNTPEVGDTRGQVRLRCAAGQKPRTATGPNSTSSLSSARIWRRDPRVLSEKGTEGTGLHGKTNLSREKGQAIAGPRSVSDNISMIPWDASAAPKQAASRGSWSRLMRASVTIGPRMTACEAPRWDSTPFPRGTPTSRSARSRSGATAQADAPANR